MAEKTYDFECPVQNPPCGFTSTGWPTRKDADARGAQHATEHETGELMPALEDFRAEHGITVTDAGVAVKASS